MLSRPRVGLFVLVACAAIVALELGFAVRLWIGGGERHGFRGTPVVPARFASDFRLVDQRGRAFHFAAQREEVTFVFFGYTHCPDVCPATLARLARGMELLGAQARRTGVLFITVDRGRDTPEQLGRYLRRFDRRFVGLTGSPPALAGIYRSYRITAEGGQHSAVTFAIDREGRTLLEYGSDAAAEDYAADARSLLVRQ